MHFSWFSQHGKTGYIDDESYTPGLYIESPDGERKYEEPKHYTIVVSISSKKGIQGGVVRKIYDLSFDGIQETK